VTGALNEAIKKSPEIWMSWSNLEQISEYDTQINE
jgi:hypothetical protein